MSHSGEKVTGVCLCHGTQVTGRKGTIAQPRPYWHTDFLSGERVKCWAVKTDERMPHDVPVSSISTVKRNENEENNI